MAKRNLKEEAKLLRDINKETSDILKTETELNSTYEKRQDLLRDLESSVREGLGEGLEKVDTELLGGFGRNAKDLVCKFKGAGAAAGLIAGAIAGGVFVMASFAGKVDAIGQSFGAIGIHSGAIRTDLLDAEIQATKLGKSLEDVVESVTTLTSEFGTGFAEARSMASSVVDTSVALGLSTSEGGQLIGTFATLSGLSNDAAVALAKQTTLLATASDVAPQQVLRDIAGSSEAVALFTDASGKNIARAAIQARKLGTDIAATAVSAENLLDVQTSLQKAVEASQLIGRNINVQKLQELSLAGDLEGFAKEQRKQLGSQSEF